jgi:hypothetical protein
VQHEKGSPQQRDYYFTAPWRASVSRADSTTITAIHFLAELNLHDAGNGADG